MELSHQYRLDGRHLFRLNREGEAYIHVANIPPHIHHLGAAVRWFELRTCESRSHGRSELTC